MRTRLKNQWRFSPKESEYKGFGKSFDYTFPPFSYTILRYEGEMISIEALLMQYVIKSVFLTYAVCWKPEIDCTAEWNAYTCGRFAWFLILMQALCNEYRFWTDHTGIPDERNKYFLLSITSIPDERNMHSCWTEHLFFWNEHLFRAKRTYFQHNRIVRISISFY